MTQRCRDENVLDQPPHYEAAPNRPTHPSVSTHHMAIFLVLRLHKGASTSSQPRTTPLLLTSMIIVAITSVITSHFYGQSCDHICDKSCNHPHYPSARFTLQTLHPVFPRCAHRSGTNFRHKSNQPNLRPDSLYERSVHLTEPITKSAPQHHCCDCSSGEEPNLL
jgi:hypothetical protein